MLSTHFCRPLSLVPFIALPFFPRFRSYSRVSFTNLASLVDLDLKALSPSFRFRKAILHFESAERLRLPEPKADATLLVVLYHGVCHDIARWGRPPSYLHLR